MPMTKPAVHQQARAHARLHVLEDQVVDISPGRIERKRLRQFLDGQARQVDAERLVVQSARISSRHSGADIDLAGRDAKRAA